MSFTISIQMISYITLCVGITDNYFICGWYESWSIFRSVFSIQKIKWRFCKILSCFLLLFFYFLALLSFRVSKMLRPVVHARLHTAFIYLGLIQLIYPEMEFKEFKPRFKSAKTRFKFSAVLKHLIQF